MWLEICVQFSQDMRFGGRDNCHYLEFFMRLLPSNEDLSVLPDPTGPGQLPRRGGMTWAPGCCPHELLWFSGASLPHPPTLMGESQKSYKCDSGWHMLAGFLTGWFVKESSQWTSFGFQRLSISSWMFLGVQKRFSLSSLPPVSFSQDFHTVASPKVTTISASQSISTSGLNQSKVMGQARKTYPCLPRPPLALTLERCSLLGIQPRHGNDQPLSTHQKSRAALSSRTLCNGGHVFYQHRPMWQPLALCGY